MIVIWENWPFSSAIIETRLFFMFFVFDKQAMVVEDFTRSAHMTRGNLSVVRVNLIWEVRNPAGPHELSALW